MVLKIKKEDYNFFFSLLGKDEQNALVSAAIDQEDRVIIDDEETEVDLYDWLNDLVVEKGFDKDYEINNTGKRLEKLSDMYFQS